MKKYKINEIFYSLQGEGFFTGKPSIFIRFSGCNLKCPFCDTDHVPYKVMTTEEIIDEVNKYPATHVVLTGGEPSLWVDPDLIEALKECGNFIAIETNGTHSIPDNIDWITLSPKFEFSGEEVELKIKKCNELKVVFNGQDLSVYDDIEAKHYFLQPCDFGNPKINAGITKKAIETCMEFPKWRLSLQTHKLTGIR